MRASDTTTARGARAEQLAADYLTQAGYRIIGRNHRCPQGEIDLIAWEGDILCFIEVRARASAEFCSPLETIGPRKIQRIIRAARNYLETLPPPWPEMRFDAVGILLGPPPTFELVRAAFETRP